MSEGIGTTRHGNQSFQLNTRKHPLQVMEENKFINPPKWNYQTSLALYNELLTIKHQRAQKEMKLKSVIMKGIVIGLTTIIGCLEMM
ncbi:MAG: hypothetical protein ACJA0X_000890 [Cyclobacteriaceae bacterium]|jgi:hypothetical protein